MKKRELRLEPLPYTILRIGSFSVISSLLYAMHIIFETSKEEYITTRNLAIDMVEYSLMTMLIIVGGALLLDYCQKKNKY